MNIKEFNTEKQELIDNILQSLVDNENKRKQLEKDIVQLVGNRTFDNDFSDIEEITGSKIIEKIDDRNVYNKYKRYHFSPKIEFQDFWLVFHISTVNKNDNFISVHLKTQTNQSLLIDLQKALDIKAFKHIVNNSVVNNDKNISYFVIEKQKRGIV